MRNRREFLMDLGVALGAITIGGKIAPGTDDGGGGRRDSLATVRKPIPKREVDFRYAPGTWQSTYCFPDDPYKSLVGKRGELLIGHPGMGGDLSQFPQVVSVGLKDSPEGTFSGQNLEAPGIPIITTTLAWDDLTAVLTSFATNEEDEGRVDNLMLEFRSNGKPQVECAPELRIVTTNACAAESVGDSASDRGRVGVVRLNGAQAPFLIADSDLESTAAQGGVHLRLTAGRLGKDTPLRYFIRFPQEQQPIEKVKRGLGRAEKLLQASRKFWTEWKPFGGKVDWKLPEMYQNFLVASSRNIAESQEIKKGKKVFEVGPTVYRGLWVVDGSFLIEAARYLGFDKDAQEGLESIWDLQNADGGFVAGAGEAHWKDTAVAVYALVRQAELAQNWDFFDATYPDAHKAMMYLRDILIKAQKDGTPNGTYGILPRGFGDSGIGGIRPEFTNSIWAWIALKKLDEAAQRFNLPKRQDIREFLTVLTLRIPEAARQEMRKHPNGFSYLPMLMKEDSAWSEKDESKRPMPQAAQIYLSQALYPGLILPPDNVIVKGHIELMKAITQEDIPSGTGWLGKDSVWPYNAAVTAQMYLWAGLRDLARKTFIGFLNHASPLFAWREEQSLRSVKPERFIGDMPHNWASAECIRYLRHMMILEDGDSLHLLGGLGAADFAPKEPITITYSPTRWGRVTVSHEPAPNKRWITKFKREDFDAVKMPPISNVILPRKLPPNIQFDSVTGTKAVKNGPDVFIKGELTSWEATWIDFSK